MIITGLARLGRDAELRYIPSGEAVASLALAFNHGKKQADGSRETQWVEASLWGKQAEVLAQYLTKGTLLSVVIDAPHIQTYDRKDGGQGVKLVGRIMNVEFAGGNQNNAPKNTAINPTTTNQAKPSDKSKGDNGYANMPPDYDDFNDSIPF